MKKISIPMRSYIRTAVVWASLGSIGGIGIGLVLVALNGFSIISLSFWFSVGILTGAVGGFLSFILYAIVYRIFKRKEPPQLLPYIKKG